jgi:hypothetical protein
MITYYEVLSGLKHQDAKRQLPAFLLMRHSSIQVMVWFSQEM